MAFRIGRLKLVYLFVIFGIGLFAWTILDQTAINRYLFIFVSSFIYEKLVALFATAFTYAQPGFS